MVIKILFWVFFFTVFYTYIGYGLLIWLLNRTKKAFSKQVGEAVLAQFEPSVALVIAAYNEEDYIKDKIENTLQLDYPADKLAVYFVTDGSNDNTPTIIQQYPAFNLLHLPQRNGKAAAMN